MEKGIRIRKDFFLGGGGGGGLLLIIKYLLKKRGQFNKTFASVIYKGLVSLFFQSLKTIATLVICTCKSFIELTPGKEIMQA